MPEKNGGFTLIELAIVLTIIALLIGGVMIGRTILASAELQQVATNFARYRDAAKLFRDKYKYLPGDMATATSLWGTATACPPVVASDTTSQATCNGDGNEKIGDPTGLMYLSDASEHFYVWQHLSNAKMIEGAYSGKPGTGANVWKPGVNIPRGRKRGGYDLFTAGYVPITLFGFDTQLGSLTGGSFPAEYGHVMVHGAGVLDSGGDANPPIAPTFTGTEAASLDLKIDDGRPGFGNLIAMHVATPATYCASDTDPSMAVYITSSEIAYCTLFFVTGL